MKSRPFNILSIICIICGTGMLVSCGTARIKNLKLEARESSPDIFVQTIDKEVIACSEKEVYKYDTDSLSAIQDKRAYSRIEKGIAYDRIYKGPMNLYYTYRHYTTMNFSSPTGPTSSSRTSITRYFDLGADKPLIYLNYDNLLTNTENCSTCQGVLQHYDKTRKSLKIWKYINWGSIAGSLVLVFTTPNNQELTDLQVYGFTGLFFGGIFSEVYRLTRVAKNEQRIEETVKAYNMFKH